MRRFASYALAAGVMAAGAGCGSSATTVASRPATHSMAPIVPAANDETGEDRVGRGPFTPSGGWAGGSGSGLWGDGATGPRGSTLGCLDDRHYSYAFGVENRSKARITLTSARLPNPAPRIVARVAIQLRLSPPQPPTQGDQLHLELVYRHWSAAATTPVTIPPGRIATVQANYLMRRCDELRPDRRVSVPSSLVLAYRRAGKTGRQEMTLPGNSFVVIPGPVKRTCDPVAGSARLVAADIGCDLARRLAPACTQMKNGGWLGCTVAGTFWECGRFAGPGYPLRETCYLPHRKSHWFTVVWLNRAATASS